MHNNDNETTVVLIRHAQSQWNRENRFTGWADPALTETGIREAYAAGCALRQAGFRFDHSYSSRLQRAVHTLEILQQELGQERLGAEQDWRLNERHYGTLQGKDKAETARIAGDEQVLRWRRGYLDLPAPLPPSDPAHPRNDARYADVPAHLLPSFENLDITRERVSAFWNEKAVPRLQRGERLLISAHGNTLRALIKELDDMSVAEVEAFEIPTATPIVYRFDSDSRPLGWQYLDVQVPCFDCAA